MDLQKNCEKNRGCDKLVLKAHKTAKKDCKRNSLNGMNDYNSKRYEESKFEAFKRSEVYEYQ